MAATVAVVDYPNQNQTSSPIKWFFILLFCLGLICSIICCEHATKKHGSDADLVRQCMEEKGPMQVWKKPDGRFANVCQISERVFGIMITDKLVTNKMGKNVHEVTSYIKENMSKFSEVRAYLERMGAVRINVH